MLFIENFGQNKLYNNIHLLCLYLSELYEKFKRIMIP